MITKKTNIIILIIIFILICSATYLFSGNNKEWSGRYNLDITREWIEENFPEANSTEVEELYKEFLSMKDGTYLILKKDMSFNVTLPDGTIIGTIKEEGKHEGYLKLILIPLQAEGIDDPQPVTALYKDDTLLLLEDELTLMFTKVK
jgi:hypothetical protein